MEAFRDSIIKLITETSTNVEKASAVMLEKLANTVF